MTAAVPISRLRGVMPVGVGCGVWGCGVDDGVIGSARTVFSETGA